jgi:hypothetical protein
MIARVATPFNPRVHPTFVKGDDPLDPRAAQSLHGSTRDER